METENCHLHHPDELRSDESSASRKRQELEGGRGSSRCALGEMQATTTGCSEIGL